MNILIISKEANGVPLGYKLIQEGHKVLMWVKDPVARKTGDGFIKKTDNWIPFKKESQLIIFDDAEMGEAAESLKKEGFTVWGGNKWSDDVEQERDKGQELFKSVGMKTIPSKDFTDLEQAIQLVQSRPARYVVKPSGPIQDEKSLTYVGKEESGSDLLAILQNYKAKWSSLIEKIEIQEVKIGIEVAIGGFFNGKDFCEPIFVNFEHKKLMNTNIGPATGEMGTTSVWMKKNKIYRETIGRCVKKLAENKYVGYFDINCIVEGTTIWPLEVTSRFGYPGVKLQLETVKNVGETIYKIAKGQIGTFQITNPYACCVVLATPPFPFKSKEIHSKYSEGQEVIFKGKDRTGYWPCETVLEGSKWVLGGSDGYSLVCTGSGKTAQESIAACYKRVNDVTIANSYWRTDIGLKTPENLTQLNRLGWFKS